MNVRSRGILPRVPGIALIVGLVLIAAAVFTLVANVRQVGQAADLVSHTHAVVDRADDLLSTVKDAETGQRGYLLTGDIRYLGPYTSAAARASVSLRELAALLAGSPEQTERLPRIRQLTRMKLDELGRTVDLVRAGRRGEALSIVRTDQGRLLMGRLREEIARLQERERQLLSVRERARESSQRSALVRSLITAVAAVAAAMIAAYLLLLRGRRAEAIAALTEKRLQATYDNAGVGIQELDAEGRFLAVNETFSRLTGYTAADLVGLTKFDLIAADTDRAAARERFERLKTGEVETYDEERHMVSRAGRHWIGQLRTTAVRDSAGRFVHAVRIVDDVTDQRQAEEGLRESEARLRRVLDQLFAFVGITDLDGTLLWVNRAPLEAAGLEAEEVIRRPFWDAGWWSYDPDVQAHLKESVARAAQGEVVRYDALVQLKDGLATIDFQIAPLRDEHGAITHLLPSAIPVEERVRAQAELERRVSQLRSIYEGVPVGLAFHDRDLRFVEINGYLASINGVPAADHVGRTLAEILPQTAQDVMPVQMRVIENGEALTNLEIRTRTAASAEERDYLLSYTPARDPHGAVTGMTVALLDITDRKRAEEEVRRLNEDLEQLVEIRTSRLEEVNAELQSFAYSVSHDLRAPLRAMEGFSQALLEDFGDRLDDAGRTYIGRIVAGARQMDVLIQDLLAYSRLTREEVEIGPVPLDAALDTALRQLGSELRERRAEIDVRRPLPVVSGQATIVAQAIANLLSNGTKFVAPGVIPHVRVRSEIREERVRLWVEDNGIGIAPDHVGRIFEVFQRLHGGQDYPGTGIGLAIVRKAMERLGGAFGVETEPGRGSRFWIELPREGDA